MATNSYSTRQVVAATVTGTLIGVGSTLISLYCMNKKSDAIINQLLKWKGNDTAPAAAASYVGATTASGMESIPLAQLTSELERRLAGSHTILFDLDGTLVESAQIWYELINAAAINFGYPAVPRHAWEDTFGQSMEKNVQLFLNGLDQQQFNDFCDKHYADYIDYLEILPGAVELLEMLKGETNIDIAITTNCPRAITNIILDHCNFKGYFKYVVCAGDIANTSLFPNLPAHPLAPKPSIDILVHAADLLHDHSSNCVFIGDSRFDMMSGRSANCITIGVGGIKSGDIHLKSIAEAMEVVKLMSRSR